MNEGAREAIYFVHHLPEPLQVAFYLVLGTAFLCAIVSWVTGPFR